MLLGAVSVSTSCRMLESRRADQEGPPSWGTSVRHFAGSVLSGPTDVNLGPVGPADVCEVSVTWVALERPAGPRFESLDRHARLIVSVPEDRAVRPVRRLTQGIRVLQGRDPNEALGELTGGALGKALVLEQVRGVVPRGGAVACALFDQGDPAAGACPSVSILVSRPADVAQGVEWAVAVTDAVPTADAGQGRESGPSEGSAKIDAASDWVTETVVMGPGATEDAQGWAVVMPSVLHSPWVRTVCALVQVRSPAQGPGLAEALDRCRRDLQSHRGPGASDPRELRLDQAVRALEQWPRWHKVLLNLADTTGATMAKDLLLIAPYWIQYRVRNEVLDSADGLRDPASASWVLDRAAYRVLIDLNREGHRTPSLEALLLLHAGQVGRDTTLLGEILAQGTDREDLHRRLIRENAIFLEDMSPAARCRALEWLAAQGKAPAGFDPLAPARQRRAALAAATDLFE